MGPRRWQHPQEDPKSDTAHFMGQDPRHPRAIGRGPCGHRHSVAMTAEATLLDHAGVEMQFNGNQNGRWMHCARCDL